jgi:hypothetical protein
VAVLFCHQQGIAPHHQIPTDRGVPRHIRPAITNGKALECALPAGVRIFQIGDRSARVREEQAIVIDAPLASQPFSQPKLTLNDRNGARAQPDSSILSGLGHILVDSEDPGFGDTQHAMSGVVVRDDEGDFLGGAESGEKRSSS